MPKPTDLLELLDFADLRGLELRGAVVVDDADPAHQRHGDRHVALGDRVHRRRDERERERDLAGERRLERDHLRAEVNVAREEQEVAAKCARCTREREREREERERGIGGRQREMIERWDVA